jgi:Protein of unknown function (DUF4199)
MNNKITPLIKGLITGGLMLTVSLVLIYTNPPVSSGAEYIGYILYAAGIAWTLIAYSTSESYIHKFGAIFGQGFRCFIIVTLIMVIFTGIYSYMHPEIAEEAAKLYKADLIKEGNKTPSEIETMVTTAKKQFVTGNIMLAIFGTLTMGAIFTAAGAGLLLLRRK